MFNDVLASDIVTVASCHNDMTRHCVACVLLRIEEEMARVGECDDERECFPHFTDYCRQCEGPIHTHTHMHTQPET